MKFEILAERSSDDRKTFIYDNITNTLSEKDNGYVFEYQKIDTDFIYAEHKK